MEANEIIKIISENSVFSIPMPENEWGDLHRIIKKIEEKAEIETHGVKQKEALKSLEYLIWYAAAEYYKE